MEHLQGCLHHPSMRAFLVDRRLKKQNIMYPVFVTTESKDNDIAGFEPNKQWGRPWSTLVEHLHDLVDNHGLSSVMLFGVVEAGAKDFDGRAGWTHTPVTEVVAFLREQLPGLMVACDVCLCEYTSHGHCGLPDAARGGSEAERACSGCDVTVVDHAETVNRLVDCALAYVNAGAHMLCPSDMMDGRVAAIRTAVPPEVAVMAYSSKKASAMYGPFRKAVASTFEGDRKRYQQPVGSSSVALRAAQRDAAEGADVLMVKPSLFYGDLITKIKTAHPERAVAAYVVSGEYVMLKQYGESCDSLDSVVLEAHESLVRAGADVLVTYFAPMLLKQV